ncbi:MAG: class I SAM-dependent methyltransferase [Actinomycetota bacterium]|nr:class I SAM-dependent methyltransferase [Actinomycetota bacterium]
MTPKASPPVSQKLIGRSLNALVARAPIMWPLVRAPMRRFFDGLAEGWDERTGAGSAEHLAPLAAALLQVSPAPERALEVGTGTGTGALLIAREFPQARVRGVDISEPMIRRARERIGLDPEGRVAFRVADAASLPYEDESFDLVAQLNMPPFFAETARVLRPGGHAVIASSWGEATPFYTPESVLRRGYRRHGLEPVESGTAGEGTFFVAAMPT